MRPAVFAGVAAAVLSTSLAGCGGDGADDGPLRIRPVFAAADGPTPPTAGFHLRPKDGGASLPLRPSREDPAVLEAEGPKGHYFVVAAPGWGIVGGPPDVEFRPGNPAFELSVGRPRTLYLVPGDPTLPVGDVAAFAETATAGGIAADPLAVERVGGEDGRVALRFSEADWKGAVRVVALLGPASLSKVVRVSLPADGSPTGVRMLAGPAAPLDVVLVPAPAGAALPESEVVAEVAHRPLVVRQAVRVRADGLARFDALPAAVKSVRLTLRTGAEEILLRPDWSVGEWRSTGEIRFLARAEKAGTGAVALRFTPGPDAPVVVQARPEGGTAYGIVAILAADVASGAPLPLPPGRYSFFVTCGKRGEAIAKPVAVTEGTTTALDCNLAPLATVRGTVKGAPTGTRVRLRLVEEDREALAASAWPDAAGTFDALLPAGRYRIVSAYGAREGPPLQLDLKAGTQAIAEIRPPR